MKFYLAYGSNLSVAQMAHRCPDASIVGMALLKDWKLAFGLHATIEPSIGDEVPVLVWRISEDDERSLDRYEGYPKYYYKDWLEIVLTDLEGNNPEQCMAMVYIMTEEQKSGFPSAEYVQVIEDGYKRFGFDLNVLQIALKECTMKKHYTFEEFLDKIHDMTEFDYDNLNDYQQKALVVEWKDLYK